MFLLELSIESGEILSGHEQLDTVGSDSLVFLKAVFFILIKPWTEGAFNE